MRRLVHLAKKAVPGTANGALRERGAVSPEAMPDLACIDGWTEGREEGLQQGKSQMPIR